jgi:two-component system sensor histidine kinase RegB
VWINYAVSAGVPALFLLHVAATLRRAALRASLASEREMSNEQVVRLGALSAGAAHELAQPLAALTMLLSELQRPGQDPRDARQLVDDAVRQVQHCQQTLASLLDYGKQGFEGEIETEALDAFARRCLEGFRARRPHIEVRLHVDGSGAAPPVRHDVALRQAVLNLLDNAADASPDAVELRIAWDPEEARLLVLDRGPGFASTDAGKPGQLFFTTKPRGHGNGLGLYLANIAVMRLGGTLRLRNQAAGGACAEIALRRTDDEVAVRPWMAQAAALSG